MSAIVLVLLIAIAATVMYIFPSMSPMLVRLLYAIVIVSFLVWILGLLGLLGGPNIFRLPLK